MFSNFQSLLAPLYTTFRHVPPLYGHFEPLSIIINYSSQPQTPHHHLTQPQPTTTSHNQPPRIRKSLTTQASTCYHSSVKIKRRLSHINSELLMRDEYSDWMCSGICWLEKYILIHARILSSINIF